MKTIIKAMLEEIYISANRTAKELEQISDKGNFFITLQQLEKILGAFEE